MRTIIYALGNLVQTPLKYGHRDQNQVSRSSTKFSFSTGGHFDKWPNRAVSPSFFSGNIANIIPRSPQKKMIPLMEDHGGAWGPPLAYGLYV